MTRSEIAATLQEFRDWAYRTNYIYVHIDEYCNEVDLGDFGYQTQYVTVDYDEYPLEVNEIIDNSPMYISKIDEMIEALERDSAEDEDETPEAMPSVLELMAASNTQAPPPVQAEEATLEDVLFRMEQNGQGALAKAIRGVVRAFNDGHSVAA